jgi:hypothetical protein
MGAPLLLPLTRMPPYQLVYPITSGEGLTGKQELKRIHPWP